MKTFWRDWAGHLLAGFALAIWFLPGLELFSTRYGLGVMLAGTSERPFAYRVLTPILVRAAEVFYGSPIPAFLFVALSVVSFAYRACSCANDSSKKNLERLRKLSLISLATGLAGYAASLI